MGDEDKKNEIAQAAVELDIAPVEKALSLDASYNKIPLEELASAGAELASAIGSLVSKGTVGGSGLYRVTLPKGASLAQLKDGQAYIGAAVRKGEGVVGQARLTPVGSVPFDPMMLGIAVALAEVNQKLDAIQKIQQEMFDFMKEEKEADLEGDLQTLADLMDSYKFNSQDESFRSQKAIEVSDIRREANHDIGLYQKQLLGKLKDDRPFHVGMDVNQKVDGALDDLKHYQMSLFLYAYAAFLEVMLRENFDASYLESESNTIVVRAAAYRGDFEQCKTWVDKFSKSTVEKFWLDGVAGAAGIAGKVVKESLIGDLTPADEALANASKGVKDFGEKHAAGPAKRLEQAREPVAAPFIESIKSINAVYNEPVELITDGNEMYVHRIEG
jgi:hypothetical protein